MKRLDKYVSLSLLGVLTVALVPIASAQGFFGRGQGISDEVRTQLEECREKETREERRECMQALKEENGLKFGRKFGLRNHANRPEISEEAKGELMACRENNEDREQRHECATAVFEKYGIEPPPFGHGQRHGRRGRGMGMGMGNCLRMEDRGEAQECFLNIYDKVREEGGPNAPER